MASKVGIWIDHSRAVIVTIADGVSEVEQVFSNVARHRRRAVGAAPATSEPIPVENKAQRAYERQLNDYYDHVIAQLNDAGEFFLFGPGSAKNELRKRIEEKRLPVHIDDVETADKMTDRQIAQRVRAHFHADMA